MGTSLWFSANSVTTSLQSLWGLGPSEIGGLVAATQIGFIAGTAVLAATGLADRFSASRVFFIACIAGAIANAAFATSPNYASALALRTLTGITLAGIYPIGMKLVVSWTRGNTGWALSLLVGMLTLGTALPHGIRAAGASLPWQAVVLASSILALIGGAIVFRMGTGPHVEPARAAASRAEHGSAFGAFRDPHFRRYAYGYFGHMWELYAFWTLVPWLVAATLGRGAANATISGVSFGVIATGTAGCIAGGVLSRHLNGAAVAALALALSGAACIAFPLVATYAAPAGLALLFVWGAAVVADSPQFSSLSARVAPPEFIGGALAAQNCIGFAVTAVAIALVTSELERFGAYVTWLLVPGPALGLVALLKSRGDIRPS